MHHLPLQTFLTVGSTKTPGLGLRPSIYMFLSRSYLRAVMQDNRTKSLSGDAPLIKKAILEAQTRRVV